MTRGIGIYARGDGTQVDVESIVLFPAQTFALGITVGPTVEVGAAAGLRASCLATAVAGTNPSLVVTVQTSKDQQVWKTVAAFLAKTAADAAMGAVTATGTTPPTITLTGTPNYEINLKVSATVGGALGTWSGWWSIDGGVTQNAFTSAATVALTDALQGATGITLNIAAGTAATDNVWTAPTASREQKQFGPLDRFVRGVAQVTGSSTPTVTASVSGEVQSL